MRTISLLGSTAVLGIIGASSVSAQPRDWGPYPWGWHYMWGSFGIGMMLFMLIFWVLVIAGAVALVRWLWNPESGPRRMAGGETAEDILKKRFARGEIDKEEYEAQLRVLRQS